MLGRTGASQGSGAPALGSATPAQYQRQYHSEICTSTLVLRSVAPAPARAPVLQSVPLGESYEDFSTGMPSRYCPCSQLHQAQPFAARACGAVSRSGAHELTSTTTQRADSRRHARVKRGRMLCCVERLQSADSRLKSGEWRVESGEERRERSAQREREEADLEGLHAGAAAHAEQTAQLRAPLPKSVPLGDWYEELSTGLRLACSTLKRSAKASTSAGERIDTTFSDAPVLNSGPLAGKFVRGL
eukprot:3453239-Rhodomonas_salina.2